MEHASPPESNRVRGMNPLSSHTAKYLPYHVIIGYAHVKGDAYYISRNRTVEVSKSQNGSWLIRVREGSWTPNPLRAIDFKSILNANSNTLTMLIRIANLLYEASGRVDWLSSVSHTAYLYREVCDTILKIIKYLIPCEGDIMGQNENLL